MRRHGQIQLSTLQGTVVLEKFLIRFVSNPQRTVGNRDHLNITQEACRSDDGIKLCELPLLIQGKNA